MMDARTTGATNSAIAPYKRTKPADRRNCHFPRSPAARPKICTTDRSKAMCDPDTDRI